MNAVLEKPEKYWTYEDYLEVGDNARFEIINGKALMSPSPELFHHLFSCATGEGKIHSAILPAFELDLAVLD